jgi:hypothetical protein
MWAPSAASTFNSAKFGRKLADAGVNIESLLEVSICQGEVIFAIAVDKPEDARAALSDQIVGEAPRALPAACVLVAGTGGM